MKTIFTVKRSRIDGKGIFASRGFEKGEVICSMKGRKVSIGELKRLYAFGKERIDDPLQIADNVYLDLKEPYVYFNHSCSPNSGMAGVCTLVAARKVKAGEEITYDYSTTEWTNDELWKINWTQLWAFKCKCHSSKCRKKITSFPRLPEKIKEKYYAERLLPGFILKKLENQKSN